jgi:ribosome-associated protein YbcJ (S4-like RNA binding protein)
MGRLLEVEMEERKLKKIEDSKLLEKCKEVAMLLGSESLEVFGSSFKLVIPDGEDVCYGADWEGRRHIRVRNRDKVFLGAYDDKKRDAPHNYLVNIGEDGFNVYFYESGSWEQRVKDIYFGMKNVFGNRVSL